MSDMENNSRQPEAIKDQGTEKQQAVRKSARLEAKRSRKQSISESNQVQETQILSSTPYTSNVPVDGKAIKRPWVPQKPSKTHQKPERGHEARHSSPQDQDLPLSERQRTSPLRWIAESAANDISENRTDPIQDKVLNRKRPKESFEQDSQIREVLEPDNWSEGRIEEWNQRAVEYVDINGHRYPRPLAKSQIQFHLQQPDSNLTGENTQMKKENQNAYRDSRYEALLAKRGSYMREFDEIPKNIKFDDVLKNINSLCENLLQRHQPVPFQDAAGLIFPSALATYGANLNHLIEGVNQGWESSISVQGPQPQPDYSVGFKRWAFTDEQLKKLDPLIGGVDDTSFFTAAYRMYFPFLSCEVNCSAVDLHIADRQNAHSMTLAVRGVVELYKAVKREKELHCQILAFSISHNHRCVKIFGHYPIIKETETEETETTIYRHPIHKFALTGLDSREKWTAYKFVKNVYDIWMPSQHKRICSALDALPDNIDFGLSQAALFPQTEPSSGFKKPELPARKKQKTEICQLRDQLAHQEKQSQTQMARIERLSKEQLARQEKQFKEQIDMFKQLLDRRCDTRTRDPGGAGATW